MIKFAKIILFIFFKIK